jgi:nitrogen regulatory protein PII-like uncharacterized protein
MPNINVRRAIEKISDDVNRVGQHIVDYSGVDPKNARFVENACEDIAKTASQIAQLAREAGRR